MSIYFAALVVFIAASCSANSPANITSIRNVNATVHNQNSNVPNKNATFNGAISKTLDCNDPNGFSLVVVEDTSRDIKDTVTTPKLLNIVVADDVMTTIKIPAASDANGFSLDWATKTKEGFEIKIEYGTRYYYEKWFNFRCIEGDFYLYGIKTEVRDKNHPENWDKPDKKEIQINPNLPIEKFSLFDYLTIESG